MRYIYFKLPDYGENDIFIGFYISISSCSHLKLGDALDDVALEGVAVVTAVHHVGHGRQGHVRVLLLAIGL
jgi:hypothetical protein